MGSYGPYQPGFPKLGLLFEGVLITRTSLFRVYFGAFFLETPIDQLFYFGLVGVVMASWGNDMGAHLVVVNGRSYGSYTG